MSAWLRNWATFCFRTPQRCIVTAVVIGSAWAYAHAEQMPALVARAEMAAAPVFGAIGRLFEALAAPAIILCVFYFLARHACKSSGGGGKK